MQNERYVAVADVDEKNAAVAFQSHGDMDVPRPIEFTSVERSYFQARYALKDRDIVIHFYVSDHVKTAWPEYYLQRWWLNDFGLVLSQCAQSHFDATTPRIMASYTAEEASWWFKAQGYNYLLDLDGYLRAFFELLDETLHASLQRGAAPPRGNT